MALAQKEQILKIHPQNELKFVGPFTSPVFSYITLENPCDKKVCFKIKTTAPKKYCVRPNSGSVDPHQSVQVAVVLQSAGIDPNEKNKHKFMVQSVILPEDTPVESVWKDVKPECLVDYKLKCVFEMNESEDENVQEKEKKSVTVLPPETCEEQEHAKTSSETKTCSQEEANLRLENTELKKLIQAWKGGNPHWTYGGYDQQKQMHTWKRINPPKGDSEDQGLLDRYSLTSVFLAIIVGLIGVLIGKYAI
ncbi:unnamed protein product [Bemisia tabaci]|uniref:MSP domain-containing protein n=1 Tax=Bemisia tabaci TaxID=7038 RepID=A0A9P0EZ84_BEMTA|nr:PREDICTED: vesicle-associated membrane protein-associated protein B-like [Bemisia tabaci]CAH0385253.1 unnamed protein product [Bemisia tabaci]